VKKFINSGKFASCMRTATILFITHVPYMLIAVCLLAYMIVMKRKLLEISEFLNRKNKG